MNRRSFIKTVFGGLAGVFLCRLAPAEEKVFLPVVVARKTAREALAEIRAKLKRKGQLVECSTPPTKRCTCDACNQPALTFGYTPVGIRPCEKIMKRYRNRQ